METRHRQAGRQEGRQAGRQAAQAGSQAERQAGRQEGRQAGRQAGRQEGRQAGRQAGRSTSRPDEVGHARREVPGPAAHVERTRARHQVPGEQLQRLRVALRRRHGGAAPDCQRPRRVVVRRRDRGGALLRLLRGMLRGEQAPVQRRQRLEHAWRTDGAGIAEVGDERLVRVHGDVPAHAGTAATKHQPAATTTITAQSHLATGDHDFAKQRQPRGRIDNAGQGTFRQRTLREVLETPPQ